MARERATAAEWERYYQRAERARAMTGDPFREHQARLAARERALMMAFTVFMMVAVAAFMVLAGQA
jgi:hypothetical protein